jgi:hypothetical protein
VLPGVGERLVRRRPPHGDENLELLLESLEAFPHGLAEGEAVGGVFSLEPAGADTQVDAATAHLVDLGDLGGEDARVTEGDRGHERAEANRGRVPGEAGKVGPRLARSGLAGDITHLQEVVAAQEGVVAEFLGGDGYSAEHLVSGALLGLCENGGLHDSTLARPPTSARRRVPFAPWQRCRSSGGIAAV